MNLQRRALTVGAVMAAVSGSAYALRPKEYVVNPTGFDLKAAVPLAFGTWFCPGESLVLDDPVAKDIYGQTLSRTYRDASGASVMLCIAYGGNQTSGLTAHKPEVCYPAQGFEVTSLSDVTLHTLAGNIDARRLTTHMRQRYEPVTYWFTEGDEVVRSRFSRRMAQIKSYLTGEIPDGVLFRISSIDADSAAAFTKHEKFASDLLRSLAPKAMKKLSGLSRVGGVA